MTSNHSLREDADFMEEYREFLKSKLWDEVFSTGQPDQQQGIPHPPVQVEYPTKLPLIDLVAPENITVGQTPLIETIKNRKSHRKFSKDPLTLEQLSFLLWATQGVHEIWRDGAATRRVVPSAGARHPFETYLVVNRVEGLEPGVYRYLAVEHKLYLIEEGDFEEQLGIACRNQKFVGKSVVTFLWTVVPYRCEWRYHRLANKLISIDVGHVCQNLYLACGAINAGTCAIGAYEQDKADELLRVDGKDEFTIYIAPVGKI